MKKVNTGCFFEVLRRLWILILLFGAFLRVKGRQSNAFAYPRSGEWREERSRLGEAKWKDLQRKSRDSDCWRDAVEQLNSTCRLLSDVEQSRLAVSFANCHLDKSGRPTYPCHSSMSILDCTRNMDSVAFQTYTEFFTHTGHICFFLQGELWQERTEGVIMHLSDASSQSVAKLELALNYHRLIEKKQDEALERQETILQQDQGIATALQETRQNMETAFRSMEELAVRQQDLLGEVYTALKASIDKLHYLMALCLVELIGYETVGVVLVSWLVILFLPQVRYSRFKLYLVLGAELALEVLTRRVYVGLMLRDASPTPSEDMSGLHSWLWVCRYLAAAVGVVLYVWEWLHDAALAQRHLHLLDDINHQNAKILQAMRRLRNYASTYAGSRAGENDSKLPPDNSSAFSWKIQRYLRSLSLAEHPYVSGGSSAAQKGRSKVKSRDLYEGPAVSDRGCGLQEETIEKNLPRERGWNGFHSITEAVGSACGSTQHCGEEGGQHHSKKKNRREMVKLSWCGRGKVKESPDVKEKEVSVEKKCEPEGHVTTPCYKARQRLALGEDMNRGNLRGGPSGIEGVWSHESGRESRRRSGRKSASRVMASPSCHSYNLRSRSSSSHH